MLKCYIVYFQEDKYSEYCVLRVFQKLGDAEQYIADYHNLSPYYTDENGDEWVNDTYFDPKYMYIEEADFVSCPE